MTAPRGVREAFEEGVRIGIRSVELMVSHGASHLQAKIQFCEAINFMRGRYIGPFKNPVVEERHGRKWLILEDSCSDVMLKISIRTS